MAREAVLSATHPPLVDIHACICKHAHAQKHTNGVTISDGAFLRLFEAAENPPEF